MTTNKRYVPELWYPDPIYGGEVRIDMAYGPFELDRLMKFIDENLNARKAEIRIRLEKEKEDGS